MEESWAPWSGQERQGQGRTTLHDQPRGSSHINDNQCVISPVQGLLPGSLDRKMCSVYSISQLYRKDSKFADTGQFKCKLKCCKSCTFCERTITKERCKSRYCTKLQREIKVCEKFGKLGWTWVPVQKLLKSRKRVTPSPFGSGQISQDIPQS